jgi:hypothetical protein
VIWGDDPHARYLIFVPTASGLVQMNVRVSVPGEGPRASAKLIRWSRVQLGELATEIQAGHRLATFQIEAQVVKGADDDADAIGAFALELFAAIDGRIDSAGLDVGGAAGQPAARRGQKAMPQLPAPKGT